MSTQFFGILLALASALTWGGGDFAGGQATRKNSPYQVLLLTSAISLLLVLLLAVLWQESLPSPRNIMFALLAGISGAVGMATLFQGLAVGKSALIAPISGVVGAIIPMSIGFILAGLPGFVQIVGFGLAFMGIWLVTRSNAEDSSQTKDSIGLAVIAGIGFGGFFGLIAQIDAGQIFTPLIFVKIASILLALLILGRQKMSLPNPLTAPVALLAGGLDSGGNLFYLLATRYARLDTVAVLASLYPAGTVILSILLLKEKVTPWQWVGILACMIAIILITLG
jgi:drug/metabolite transporter (DMT)-like permease